MTRQARAQTGGDSRSRWFAPLHLLTTVPVLAVIVGVGYAVGHAVVGAIAAATFLVALVLFGRWARGNRARIRKRLESDPSYRTRYYERSDRISRFAGWYFAALGVLIAVVVVAWVVARLA